jgi:hypothetical protein
MGRSVFLVFFAACVSCGAHACERPTEGGQGVADSGDSGAPAASPGAVIGAVDRAKAEKIALLYAQVHWPAYAPRLATAFNTGVGRYRVVVGFDRRPDAASVFVRAADGQVVNVEFAGLDAESRR